MKLGNSELPNLLIAAYALTLLLAMGPTAYADDTASVPPPPPNMSPELKAALSSCASSVAKDENGRPQRKAMDACMKAKGFAPPQHGPGGDGQRPPPQDD